MRPRLDTRARARQACSALVGFALGVALDGADGDADVLLVLQVSDAPPAAVAAVPRVGHQPHQQRRDVRAQR